jgi:hypothetical protein
VTGHERSCPRRPQLARKRSPDYQRFGKQRDVSKTRKISTAFLFTRYGTMKRVLATTSSRVLGTRPGLPRAATEPSYFHFLASAATSSSDAKSPASAPSGRRESRRSAIRCFRRTRESIPRPETICSTELTRQDSQADPSPRHRGGWSWSWKWTVGVLSCVHRGAHTPPRIGRFGQERPPQTATRIAWERPPRDGFVASWNCGRSRAAGSRPSTEDLFAAIASRAQYSGLRRPSDRSPALAEDCLLTCA